MYTFSKFYEHLKTYKNFQKTHKNVHFYNRKKIIFIIYLLLSACFCEQQLSIAQQRDRF